MSKKKNILEVKDLIKTFPSGKKKFVALGGISFTLEKGKTLGLVGESGSGKSTAAMAICALDKPTSGQVKLNDQNILEASKKELKHLRKQIQIVFQDPYASLNPRFTALETVMEGFIIHKLATKTQAIQLSQELLLKLGITADHIHKFPYELSGGQRQRISLARALAVSPQLLILDEPLSSLDVSVQAQIVVLLKNLQETENLSFLFISHDLAMVRYFCHDIAVLYGGFLMEQASAETLFTRAKHPYTQLLQSSIPLPDPIKERARSGLHILKDIPPPSDRNQGCVFANRCPKAQKICFEKKPLWEQIEKDHFVACHFWNT